MAAIGRSGDSPAAKQVDDADDGQADDGEAADYTADYHAHVAAVAPGGPVNGTICCR